MSSPSYLREELRGFGSDIRFGLLHWRCRSLLRANLLVLACFAAAFWISGFPEMRPTPWLALPLLGALAGAADAMRCMRKHWSFYHGAVLISLYMHLMAIMVIVVFLVWPYAKWFL